ncbi:hypothetical protein ONT15_12680, partial [Prevotella copri]|jgi:hypothetical protein|uniref:hypothetical protein n=1 Tax=Segatella copri TaxID=165179 RepID=UPI002232B03F
MQFSFLSLSFFPQLLPAPFTFLLFYLFTLYSSFYLFTLLLSTFIYFPVKNYGESSLVTFMHKMLMNGGFSL